MIELLIAIILFIVTYVILRIDEGFYDPSKEDQRPFEMEDHSYDGDLFQAEKILYDSIIKLGSDKSEIKNNLGELLNILQFI